MQEENEYEETLQRHENSIEWKRQFVDPPACKEFHRCSAVKDNASFEILRLIYPDNIVS